MKKKHQNGHNCQARISQYFIVVPADVDNAVDYDYDVNNSVNFKTSLLDFAW